ncbi:MAG TPA: hypothetical protein VM779_07590 [Thermoanaerobaculia bacterium]|nr:hypothetical protein [Thermoanaerobaculia bacterium]
MESLTDEEIRRFADACADPSNEAARQAMLAAGASSATGVLAKILLAPPDERKRLVELIRRAISD